MNELKRSLNRLILLQWGMLLIPWCLLQIGLYALYSGNWGSDILLYVLLAAAGVIFLASLFGFWSGLMRFINLLAANEDSECDYCGLFSCWNLWSTQADMVGRHAPGYTSALYVSYAVFPLAILAGIFHLPGTMFILLLIWCATSGMVRSALICAVTDRANVVPRRVKWGICLLFLLGCLVYGYAAHRANGVEKMYRVAERAERPPARKPAENTGMAFPETLPELDSDVMVEVTGSWDAESDPEALAKGEALLFANRNALRAIRAGVAGNHFDLTDAAAHKALWERYELWEQLNLLTASAVGDYREVRASWEALARFRDRLFESGQGKFALVLEMNRIGSLERLVNGLGLGSSVEVRRFLADLEATESVLARDADLLLRIEMEDVELPEDDPAQELWQLLPELKYAAYSRALARFKAEKMLAASIGDSRMLEDAFIFLERLPYGAARVRAELYPIACLLESYWRALRFVRGARVALMLEQELRTRGGLPENLTEFPRDPRTGLPFIPEEISTPVPHVKIGSFQLKIR